MDKEEETSLQPKTVNTFCSFQNHHPILTLPKEIVIEILVRLPVKCLLQCKSVCKLWYSLISDRHFVKSHLSFSASNNDCAHHSLILCGLKNNLMSCPLYGVMHDESVNLLELDYPLKESMIFLEIVGSCDGLLCLKTGGDGLYILNPSTKRLNMLPYFGLKAYMYGFGFGYDESSEDYKVVALFEICQNETWVRMYSLKTAKWKRIGDFPLGHSKSASGVFFNGALHWTVGSNIVSSSSWRIVFLDLTTETYEQVPQPVYDEGDKYLTLGVLGEWLCMLCDYRGSHADVWVMKVYGEQDSWTKLTSLRNNDEFWGFLVPYFPNNGKILLHYGTELVLYDAKDGSIIKTMDFEEYHEVLPWIIVDSLVSSGEQ